MALQVWLPLNGNLNNNGLSDVTVTNNGATVDDNGKIGKCYSFDGNDDFISISCSDLYNTFSGGSQPFSIAFWVYHADTTRAVIFGDFGLSGTINFNIELTSDAHRVRFYWNGGTPDKIFNTNSSVGINTWTHIVLVYDGNEICIYKNGVQQSDKYSGTLAAKSKTSGVFYLGRDQRTGSTALNGKLNDIRIYDHALSPREVKEISKGLVLHYPLAMPGQENLVTGSNTNSTSTNKWFGHSAVGGNTSTIEVDETGTKCVKVTRDSTAQSSWDFLSYDALLKNQLKTNTVYTVSFDAKPSVDGTITLNGFKNGNSTNNMIASVVQIQSNLLANKWNHCVYRCTTLDSFDGITISSQVIYLIRSTSLKGINTTVLFKNIKVEEGEIDTPWIPNPADPAYSALGLNDGIEYDVSGYNYNGTKYGTLTYSSDTPRYNTSAVFNGSSDIRSAKSSFGWFDFKEGTVAAWFKPANTTQTWASVGVQNDGGQGSRSFSICNYSGKAATVVGYDSSWGYQSSDYSMSANVWYHLCATITNGDTVKLYVNGELVQTRTVTNTTGTIASTTQFAVGVDLPGSDERFTGHLSDVRFYTTALSAADVLELYHAPITLANNGTLLTQGEYEEV